MGRKKKLSRLKINEELQEKLNSIQDVEPIDVYKPKKEENIGLQFLEIVGDEEFTLSDDKKEVKEEKSSSNKIFIDIVLGLVAILGLLGIVLIFVKLIM